MRGIVRPFIAELIGTFAFVFISAGAVVSDQYTHGAIGLTGIAIAQGLSLFAMLAIFVPISGGHFNPAVSVGFFIAKKMNPFALGRYVVAQILGAVAAALLLRLVFASSAVWLPVHLGAPALAPSLSLLSGFAVETLLSFFLMLAMLGTVADPMAPKLGGLAVGAVMAFSVLFAAHLTGAGLNPAKAFGLGMVCGFWESQWIYWIGPLIGASFASWLYTRYISETI